MRIEIALTLILAFITIYSFLIRIYSILFRLTGLTKNKSRFQAVSLLTNSGYTTSESEIVTTNGIRRKIAMASMITGYTFSVIIVSLVLNLINSLSVNNFTASFITLLTVFGFFAFLFIFFKLPFIKKPLEKAFEHLAKKMMRRGINDNIITLLDSYGKDAMAEITINFVPSVLENKKLFEINPRDLYRINVLMLKRNGVPEMVTKETVIEKNDIIVVFGPLNNIKKIFITNKTNDLED